MPRYKNPIPVVDFPDKKQHVDLDENEYNFKESVYFAFIDVLGFKKAFDDNRQTITDPTDDKFAEKFKRVFRYYFSLMNSANFVKRGRSLCYAGQTSDSLYFYTEREDILVEFLKIYVHFSAYAMTQDVFFRGGIAKGRLFYKRNYQFYGDSVINAYMLESQISKNPIIVIDENTYNAIAVSSECNKLVDKKNERYYIKPFAYLEQKFDLDFDESSLIIRNIDEDLLKSTIEQNKIRFEYDARNYEKYVFLLNEYQAYFKKSRVK
ncbi:hypothetical protein F8154_05680 [Alkaliphilus pronyensis]|uniref:Guanylate cyclase domain-containing protein n=1 Tax=Alkaliphilus pronyensis TaxID=1482732 RepID=A0A6I0FHI7_9FIRM|nr:hypothetical protein [Alkaliphilus pronyensis]KAB3535621.1 hypothetical protein F8154_05680 [Alkaliphilus pronyensis]